YTKKGLYSSGNQQKVIRQKRHALKMVPTDPQKRQICQGKVTFSSENGILTLFSLTTTFTYPLNFHKEGAF
ncbi:MAG: hypothetical protein P8016_15185, partial [Sedimentisphaerales bacterium]